MSTRLTWSPIPGHLPPDLADEFANHSLPREIAQTNLVFYAFALFAVCNLAIDVLTGHADSLVLNGFLAFLSLAATFFMRRVLDARWLRRVVEMVAFAVVAAIVLAKTELSPDDWFVYFADLLIIGAIMLSLPAGFFSKLGYSIIILVMDVVALLDASFSSTVAAGVVLMLSGGLLFSAIVYLQMQKAHFDAFLALKREQDINLRLNQAEVRISTLQGLLPVCASCKKMRDEAGNWYQIDDYVRQYSDADVSHGVCPDCAVTLRGGTTGHD